jgi:hypothetical protein
MRFQNEAVTTFKLDSYKELIPEELFTRLRTGEYYAAAAIKDDGQTFGVYVTDIIDGWIRIIWLGFSDPDISTAEKALFIRYCIRREKKRAGKDLKGAFAEITGDDAWQDAREAYLLAGMEIREVDGNNYEFTLSQVDHTDMLKSAAEKLPCIPLKDAGVDLLDLLEQQMQNDERPVPVPSFVDYESYDQDISCICLIKDQPKGALLVSHQGDYLVLEAAYSSGKYTLPAVLGHSLFKALEMFGPDKKVLAPVVVFKSEQIIEEMVAGEKREKIMVAVHRF